MTDLDFKSFEHLDELVQALVKTDQYRLVHRPLHEIVHEVEQIVLCLHRLDQLMRVLSKEPGSEFPASDASLLKNPDAQLPHLKQGYSDLVSVATEVLPKKAFALLRSLLH